MDCCGTLNGTFYEDLAWLKNAGSSVLRSYLGTLQDNLFYREVKALDEVLLNQGVRLDTSFNQIMGQD
jgi:hypothetical protein